MHLPQNGTIGFDPWPRILHKLDEPLGKPSSTLRSLFYLEGEPSAKKKGKRAVLGNLVYGFHRPNSLKGRAHLARTSGAHLRQHPPGFTKWQCGQFRTRSQKAGRVMLIPAYNNGKSSVLTHRLQVTWTMRHDMLDRLDLLQFQSFCPRIHMTPGDKFSKSLNDLAVSPLLPLESNVCVSHVSPPSGTPQPQGSA